MKPKQTGNLGEKLAAGFLSERGYQILETNYYCREGELDIVARDGDSLAFVEVKTRRGDGFGSPEESVTAAKKARLIIAGQRYLEQHEQQDCPWRIDFVSVRLRRGQPPLLDLIQNAVGAD